MKGSVFVVVVLNLMSCYLQAWKRLSSTACFLPIPRDPVHIAPHANNCPELHGPADDASLSLLTVTRKRLSKQGHTAPVSHCP